MKHGLILVSYLCAFVCAVVFTVRAAPSDQASDRLPQASDSFARGLTALKENRLDEALAELSAAEREWPADARIRNFRGILLVRMGRNTEAASEYQEATRLDPLLEDAYRNLGFLCWTEHQTGPAREELELALRLSPNDFFAHYYLGRVELDDARYERAFSELELSRQPLPDDPAFLMQAATGYIALGRTENARRSLDKLRQSSLSESQSIQVASLLLSVHENNSAISLIKKLNRDSAINLIRNSNKNDSAAHANWAEFDLALAYLLAGNYEQAAAEVHVYTDAVAPGHSEPRAEPRAWSLMGIAYAHLKQSDRSVNAFQQAANLAPDEEENWLNLTRELMELNRYPDAIKAVQTGLAANPKSYTLHLRLGAAYLAAGRYADAENVFRDLVLSGDPLPNGYIGLAQVLLRTSRAEEAAAELGDAEKKLGPQFLISYFRGLAFERANKPLEAMAAFQEAVQLNSNSGDAHLNLGKTELAHGDVNQAIADLQQTLRLNPGNQQATRLLSQAYRRAGDAKNAAKFAEASAETPITAEDDIVGDFIVPQWQVPPPSPAK